MDTMTILVADDNPVIRKLFEKRLGDGGYEVTVAPNGAQAARLLDTVPFDVVIADLASHGEIGGIELLNRAKEKSSDIKVIIITADSSVDTVVAVMKKGADDVLEKPVPFDQLFFRLEKIAQGKASKINAGDLQETLDPAGSLAAQTNENLEIINRNQEALFGKLKDILSDSRQDAYRRLEQALQFLQSRQTSIEQSLRMEDASAFYRLEQIVATLRGEKGCPWDIKQTPTSLKQYLLEECRELADAIDNGGAKEIGEEIGDVFFILTMLIAMFAERHQFTADDVLEGIIAKMTRRHPHVFGDVTLTDTHELQVQWQRIKAEEKQSTKPAPS